MNELTPRQIEILSLLAQGMTAREIAEKTHMTLAAVQWQVRTMKEKMGARNAIHLVYLAAQQGVIDGSNSENVRQGVSRRVQ